VEGLVAVGSEKEASVVVEQVDLGWEESLVVTDQAERVEEWVVAAEETVQA